MTAVKKKQKKPTTQKTITKLSGNEVFTFAKEYNRLGFSLLPIYGIVDSKPAFCACGNPKCTSPGKHPISKLAPHGVLSAVTDSEDVRRCFDGATCNIAIATGSKSGIVAIDVDPRHGGDVSLVALEEQYGVLPKTLRWETGGGGEHIIFKNPEGNLNNSVGKLGAGLDVRAEKGYIVVPPSRHISGGSYHFDVGQSLATPILPMPGWLLKQLRGRTGQSLQNGSQVKLPVAELASGYVPEGQRNNSIASLAGYLLARKVAPRICLDLMQAFNLSRCNPPLSADEVQRTVLSIDRLAFTKIQTTR